MATIHIDFFKTTGKWYTQVTFEEPGSLPDSLGEFLRQKLTETVEGKTRVRFAGMTAVAREWRGVPRLAVVPEPELLEKRARVCSTCRHTHGEHNSDEKTCGRCDETFPVGDSRACTGFKAETPAPLKIPTCNRCRRQIAPLAPGGYCGWCCREGEPNPNDALPEEKCLAVCSACEGGKHSKCSMERCKCKVRHCNRHDDCDAADAKAKAKFDAATPKEKIDLRERAEHCDDETCEDCFGS